ncbi:MAG: hypothetical protein WCA35_31575 [Kovacikia sp.]
MNSIFRKNGSKYIIWELATVLAIWAISVWMSYYPYNRALSDGDWLTAHTLVSMRAFDNWGFFHLFGASTFIPYSYELQGADLTTFTKEEGIYLSYPSLWLIFPYVIFRVVSLFSANYELTPAFIITYNLIVNRLLCGIVVYFTFRYLLDYLFHDYLFYKNLSSLGQRALAIIGLAGWMLPASAMVNTQNLYFSDQAVLLPIYCLFLFTLKHKFDFWNFRLLDRLILGVLSLISVGMDWYGLVFVAVVFGTVTILTYAKHNNETRWEIFRRIAQNILIPLACGAAIMLAFYLSQLVYFDDGFRQIINTFTQRTRETPDDTNVTLSYLEIYSYIINHWKGYLPVLARAAILGLQKVFQIPGSATILLFVFAPVLSWLCTSKSARNLNKFAALSLLYLAPCIQLLLLKQHSYQHGFSAFKMALPISFSTYVLPVVFVIYVASRLDSISGFVREVTLVLLLSAYFLPFALKIPSKDYLGFSDKSKTLYRDLGMFVNGELPSKAIIFSNSLKTSIEYVGQKGDASLWYTNRYVYSPKDFASEKPKLQKNRVDGAEFLFIDYEDAVWENKIDPNITKICEGKWFKYDTLIEGRRIVGCNTEELKLALSN